MKQPDAQWMQRGIQLGPCKQTRSSPITANPSAMTRTVEKKVLLLVSSLASFLVPYTVSSIAVALPAMGAEFNLDAVQMGWITSAYLLTAAVCIVPFGKLADLYGRKKLFLIGNFPVYYWLPDGGLLLVRGGPDRRTGNPGTRGIAGVLHIDRHRKPRSFPRVNGAKRSGLLQRRSMRVSRSAPSLEESLPRTSAGPVSSSSMSRLASL